MNRWLWVGLGVLIGVTIAALRDGRAVGAAGRSVVVTNEAYIQSITAANLDLSDSLDVLAYVLANLPETAHVLPSENYYYFRFPVAEGMVTGSIGLFPYLREQGRINFSYRLESREQTARFVPIRGGGGGVLGAPEGVRVRGVDDRTVDVTYRGRTVRFVAARLRLRPPPLTSSERYVGPSQDESGLRFHLVFNERASKLYWILDESSVPEVFRRVSERVVRGERTGLAFYEDAPRGRRILVGAAAADVIHNTWFDGPFDQMPDNLVHSGEVQVLSYLAAAYPEFAGRIDRYGRLLDEPGSRVPVANYRVYYDEGELGFVYECERSAPSPDALYACLTQQVFPPPPS